MKPQLVTRFTGAWWATEVLNLATTDLSDRPLHRLSRRLKLVRIRGYDPRAFRMSNGCSATELDARAPSRIRTSEMSACKTDAFGRLAKGASWCPLPDSNRDLGAF